jgi:membrane-associated protease RseP (regulator of RpoE activity)
MKKSIVFLLFMGSLFAGSILAQQKAQIRIKKNINGVESEETREVIIDSNQSLEDVLRELNEQPQDLQKNSNQQIEISIFSDENVLNRNEGKRSLNVPGFPSWQGMNSGQKKPLLGVMLKEVAPNKSDKGKQQVSITEVIPQTPAAKSGLQAGDVFVSINKKDIFTAQDVIDQVHSVGKGGELKIIVSRDGKKKKIKAIIDEPIEQESTSLPFNLQFGNDSILMINPLLGDSMRIIQPFNLNGEGLPGRETAFLGVTPSNKISTSGVAIMVEKNSPAEAMGLQDEDIVLEFNGEIVGDFGTLANAVRKCKPESAVDILIIRNGKERSIAGTLGKRASNGTEDFQIFHDFKGMDDEGNYFYDFEFNMDAGDLQRQMEDFFRELNGGGNSGSFNIPDMESSPSLLRLEEPKQEDLSMLALGANTIAFNELSLVPAVSNCSIAVRFSLEANATVVVQLKDGKGYTLLYDEKQLKDSAYERTFELAPYPTGDYYLIIEQAGKSYVKQVVKYRP